MIAAALLAPWFGHHAVRAISVNANDPLYWIPADFPVRAQYERFCAEFESDDLVVVSWPGCTIDDARLLAFGQRLRELPTARNANGAAYFDRVITGAETIQLLTSPPLKLPRDVAVARLKGSLVGPDGRASWAVIAFTRAGLAERDRGVALIEETLAREFSVPLDEQHLAGPIIDGWSVDRASAESLQRFTGPCAAIILILGYACLRAWRLAALIFGISAYAVVASLALIDVFGQQMSAPLIVLPPLILVLGLSGGVHLVNYYWQVRAVGAGDDAPARMLAMAWLPCSIAAGTTALGLASLLFSELIPIQMFGMYGTIGVLLVLALMFLIVPGALDRWYGRTPLDELQRFVPRTSEMPRWQRWFAGGLGHPTLVTTVLIVGMTVAGAGTARLQASVRIQTLFSANSRILQDYAWLEDHIAALAPTEVVVRAPMTSAHDFAENVELIEQLREHLARIPHIQGALCAANFAPIPEERPGASAVVRRVVQNRAVERHREEFVKLAYLHEGPEWRDWRITLRASALAPIDYGFLLHDVQRAADNWVAARGLDWQVACTGAMPMVHEVQRELLIDLAKSFAAALLTITVVLSIALRGVVRALLAMIPNLFPLALLFGPLGWAGVPVDIGVVMTASVALGMAIDGTAHFLTFHSEGLRAGNNSHAAVQSAMRHSADALVRSTMICACGLMVYGFSSFVPTRRFAWMMLGLLWAALAGDLILLPAMLLTPLRWFFRARPSERGGRHPVAADLAE